MNFKKFNLICLICILNFVNGFRIEDHKTITQKAIFYTAAEIFHIPVVDYSTAAEMYAAAFGTLPTGMDLTTSRIYTTKPFEKAVHEINSYLFDLESNIFNPKFYWNEKDISPSIKLLEKYKQSFFNQARKFNLEYMRKELAKIIYMVQDFYARTNWLESEISEEANFLINTSEPFDEGVIGGNENGKEDPSNPLYEKALELALFSTRKLFDQLKEAIDLKKFKILFGIEGGKTIAFNIDDTGSMSDIIKAAKEHAIQIGQAYASSKNPPQKYILQPFNDPLIGKLTITNSITDIENEINKLNAHDGGDEPELCLSGLVQIMNNLEDNSYSEIFVYTDASAKDISRLDEVNELISKKKPRISFLLNYINIFYPYDVIAERSRGDVLRVSVSTIASTVDYLISKSSSVYENLLDYSILYDYKKEFNFSIDPSIYEFKISITGTKYDFVLKDPAEFSTTPIINTNLDDFKVYSVKNPTPGQWSINFNSTDRIRKLTIEVVTTVSLNIKLVAEINTDLIDGSELKENLPINEKIGAIINIFGNDPSNFIYLNKLEIIDERNNLIQSIDLEQVDSSTFYVKSIKIPEKDFKIKINGIDSFKMPFERMDNKIYRVTTLTSKSNLKSIKGNLFTINYELNNFKDSVVDIEMKVETCDDFIVHPFYVNRNFFINGFDYFSDIVLLEKNTSNIELCTVKLIFNDKSTKKNLITKVIDMNYLEYEE